MSPRKYTSTDLATMSKQGLGAKLPDPKPKKPRNNEESRSQIALFRWWNANALSQFNLPPVVMHSVPNGGFRGIITATIMKREGQQRGVFDIKLNVPRKGRHGMWLEMKARDGKTSLAQEEFRCAMIEQGYACAVCSSTEDAVKTITEYLT